MPPSRGGPIGSPRARCYSSSPSPKHLQHLHLLPNGRSSSFKRTAAPPRTLMRRSSCFILSLLLRKHRLLMVVPMVYIVAVLLYMSSLSMDLPLERKPDPPGSVYRSEEVFRNLWPAMQNDSYSSEVAAAWQFPKEGEGWVPCLERPLYQDLPPSNGYIMVEANGGLNQQRVSIGNAVAVAKLLNATLVIPNFHFNSVWQDTSTFGEIYDEEHFINALKRDVRIIPRLPQDIVDMYAGNLSSIYKIRVKALAPVSFYLENALPKLLEFGVIRISPFANRLSFDHVPEPIQRARCFANHEALRFAKPIADTGNLLVERMIERSSGSNGKYVAVHLRYEEDMVAFSCCKYGGGEAEQRELDEAREKAWKGKFKRKGRIISPGSIRMDGKCPLTPLEVGMMLRGMGFTNSTPIYLASGKIYKEEETMRPLKQMFPFLQTKETLLSKEELASFKKHSSRLAALDYTVCLHSEVFVSTHGGNFPHFLMGHRRYLNHGHAKTIKPDKRKLVLLLDNPDISWESFSRHMHQMRMHNDVKGHELRKPSNSVYTWPAPDCMRPERQQRQQEQEREEAQQQPQQRQQEQEREEAQQQPQQQQQEQEREEAQQQPQQRQQEQGREEAQQQPQQRQQERGREEEQQQPQVLMQQQAQVLRVDERQQQQHQEEQQQPRKLMSNEQQQAQVLSLDEQQQHQEKQQQHQEEQQQQQHQEEQQQQQHQEEQRQQHQEEQRQQHQEEQRQQHQKEQQQQSEAAAVNDR